MIASRLPEAPAPPVAEAHELIIDSVPGLVAILNPAGEIEAVNDQVLEYCGQPLDSMRHWGTNGIVHPEDAPRITPIFSQAIASGVPYDFDARIRRFDGVYRWFRVRGRPLRDSDQRIERWYALLSDIDERKRAEALLGGEKRLLEMVARGESMSAILDGICRLVESTAAGSHCSVVLVDPSGTRLAHGAAPSLPDTFVAAIVGRPVKADSGPCAMAAYLNKQVIAADLTTETRWVAYAWSEMAMAHGLKACWSTPIASMAGKVLGAFAIYYDEPRGPSTSDQGLIEQVTDLASIAIERTQEAEALKRSEAFLADGQHLSATGTFWWRTDTDEIAFSAELYRIFAFTLGTPVTIDQIVARVHPDDLPLLREKIAHARAGGTNLSYEIRLRMADGLVKYLRTAAHGTLHAAGRLEYVGAMQDITEQRLADEALAGARAELTRVARITTLGAMTASIAHEVNQPLSGIITNASTCLRMLSAEPPNVEGARETARRTIRDGNRAADVITKLRALYGHKETTLESVDLNEAAREVIALSRDDLQGNRVVLHTEFAESLPNVRGDRVQLQQVVLNLLRNASDAMSTVDDRPRDLLIKTELDDSGSVRLTVQDTGIGFEPEAVERLFGAFYTTKADGMGMGLSVSRSIIERHRGRLWGTRHAGPGATFAFSMPVDTKV